jgi:hypothetical protein
MNKQEQKEYIVKHFKLSSGKRITEMLLRFWGLKNISAKTQAELAEEIFNK